MPASEISNFDKFDHILSIDAKVTGKHYIKANLENNKSVFWSWELEVLVIEEEVESTDGAEDDEKEDCNVSDCNEQDEDCR